MSFSETCVRPRLLFGRYLQAHCEREGSYHKSTIDLNDCLKNNNGNFTSKLNKETVFDFPCDSDCNIHLDEGKVVAELPTNKLQVRNHAIYDLDICLCNENGKLGWKIQDGLLDRDGGITKAVEAIPGLGFIVALIHMMNGSIDHAKRALTLSGKGAFAILFSILGIAFGGFNPAIASIAAFMSFLGTVIADLTIETGGRSWIKNKRVAADIPDRSWLNTLLDGFVAGAAVGAATGIAPHAEEAAARVLKSVAIVPEEIAIAEIELLSVQNLVYNAPKLGREIAKAATGGVVRATPAGIQLLTAQGPEAASSSTARTSNVTLGKYYIANAQTGHLLQSSALGDSRSPRTSSPQFNDSQVWVIEQGSTGFAIRSSASDQYIGINRAEIAAKTLCGVGRKDAIEFHLEGNYKQGFCFVVADGPNANLVLDLNPDDDASVDGRSTKLSPNSGTLQQRWILEEDCYPDTLELYCGPISQSVKLRICDLTTSLPLQFDSSRKSAFSWTSSNGKTPVWTLEPGFDGYYIKHTRSGLYVLAGPRQEDVKTLPLTLGNAETEFILDGNNQDGYSIIYAHDNRFGLDMDTDANSQTLLLWKPDDIHSKWRIENIA